MPDVLQTTEDSMETVLRKLYWAMFFYLTSAALLGISLGNLIALIINVPNHRP